MPAITEISRRLDAAGYNCSVPTLFGSGFVASSIPWVTKLLSVSLTRLSRSA
jgi:hypothetical protein